MRLQLFNVDPAELVHRHLDQVPPPQPQDVGALQQVIQYKRGELCSTISKANNRSSFQSCLLSLAILRVTGAVTQVLVLTLSHE